MKRMNFFNQYHSKSCLTILMAFFSMNATLNAEDINSYAINVGGNAYQAVDGTQYITDNFYTNGNLHKKTVAISDTQDDVLYQSERWGSFSYNLPIENGIYDITLKFSENWASASGVRKFNVNAEGMQIDSAIDIYEEVGQFKSLDKTYEVSVTDGNLNLEFLPGGANNPKLSALLVKKIMAAENPEVIESDLNTETTEITTKANIDDSGVYLTAYEEKVLVSWNAKDNSEHYGVVSQIDISKDSDFELEHEFDFGKECEHVGGITTNEDGSRIAVLCLGFTNTYHHAEDREGHSPTQRPEGLDNFFPEANFYNLLAKTGQKGFFYGDTFTFTENGNDLFVLEFTNGLDNTPDNVILVNSATFAHQYGHLNISLNPADNSIYHLSSKVRSNQDSVGRIHTDMKQLGLRRHNDGTYSRIRLSNRYGTNFGATHNDRADVSYNKALKKWGMIAWGDDKVAWSTVPDHLELGKPNGSHNEFNKSEFVLLDGIVKRNPSSIISLEDAGFMALAEYDNTVGLIRLPGQVSELGTHRLTYPNIIDRGYAHLSHYLIDSDNMDDSLFLMGWSPEEGQFVLQTVNMNMELVGSPTILPNHSGWQKNGQWTFSEKTSNVSFVKISDDNKFQLTVIK